MNARRVWTLVLALAMLATSARAASSASIASAPPTAATLPPQLQALEQKMEQLQVNSERFSVLLQGVGKVTSESSGGKGGKPIRRTRHVSLSEKQLGEASLSPAEGEIFKGSSSRPSLIAIGSTLYLYQGRGTRRHRQRPWVRLRSPGESLAALVFPFHGGTPSEMDAGGRGSYAGLINLLSTAVGAVSTEGQVSIQGQPTTRFSATVEPLRLVKGLSAKELEVLDKHRFTEKLTVFVTEAGLPIRVVAASASNKQFTSTQTTEILAVNVPVNVRRPPAHQTAAEPSLTVKHHGGSSTMKIEVG
jgi:hypothetical protein